VGAALGDSLPSLGREGESEGLLQFRHINALLLEVWVLANHASRVELGSTSSVRVASTHDRALFGYRTLLSHSRNMLTRKPYFANERFICRIG
jgi:hypothetical protein